MNSANVFFVPLLQFDVYSCNGSLQFCMVSQNNVVIPQKNTSNWAAAGDPNSIIKKPTLPSNKQPDFAAAELQL